MNKLIPTIALIISSILITSCSNSANNTVQETTPNPPNTIETTEVTPSTPDTSTSSDNEITNSTPGTSTATGNQNTSRPVNNTATGNQNTSRPVNNTSNSGTDKIANTNTNKNQPKIATVKELVTGDIICYATIVDEQGKQHNIGASFEICAESAKYLNQKVRLSYEIASLNDCESNEPCGKTRQETIISQMEIITATSTPKPAANDTSTYSNGKWTITIGNYKSWDGVNNTGNLSYKGCDDQGNCIELTGGKVSCRDGQCVTGWVNGQYRYIWSSPITEDGSGSPTLMVRQGDKEILQATGFKALPNS
jgi:hypothetical protein